MDEQNPTTQPQQPIDQNLHQSDLNIQPKRNWYKYGFLGLFSVISIILVIFGLRFINQKNNFSPPNQIGLLIPPQNNNVISVTSIPPNKQPTTINTFKTFNDSRLEGMKFNYDPIMWNARFFNNNDEEIMNEFKNAAPGTILREIGGSGKLFIYYTVELAQGGGISLFGNGDVVNLTDTIARVKIQGEYLYGSQKNLVLFDKSPEEKNFLLKTCDDGPNPVIDETGCAYIKSGQAIGYVNQPAFNYSFKLKRNIPLKEFGFGELESVVEDKERLIVVISYQGNKPEDADMIINQIGINH